MNSGLDSEAMLADAVKLLREQRARERRTSSTGVQATGSEVYGWHQRVESFIDKWAGRDRGER